MAVCDGIVRNLALGDIVTQYTHSYRSAQGFAIVDLLFTIGVIGVLSAIALPKLASARQTAGTSSAIATLRTVNSGEIAFAITCGNGFYAPSLTSLAVVPPGAIAGFLPSGLGLADVMRKSGYEFELAGTAYALAAPTCNGLGAGLAAQAYKVRGDPLESSNTRFLATNASMQIYEHTASLWGGMPEAGAPAAGHLLR